MDYLCPQCKNISNLNIPFILNYYIKSKKQNFKNKNYMEIVAIAAELAIDDVLLDNHFKDLEIVDIIKEFLG